MIPYELDPSLHDVEPVPPLLGDGFSPRNPTTSEEAGVPPFVDDDSDVWAEPTA